MIKKLILLGIIAFSINSLVAQENIAKISAIFGNQGIQYERTLSLGNYNNKHFSIIGQIGYSKITTTINNVETNSTGIGYYLEGRYYFSSNKDIMEGWHIGPFYNRISTKDSKDLKTNISSFGLATGYQWIFKSHITLGIIIGAGTLNVDSDKPAIEFLDGIDFLPHLGFTLGYNF